MVEFIKNTSLYGLFILESDAVNNDDWEGDHQHPKEADYSLYTEGAEIIFLPGIIDIDRAPDFDMDALDFFDGEGAPLGMGEGHDLIIFMGRFGGTSEANRTLKMANLMLFFWKHMKSEDEQIYLCCRKRGEVWEPFINPTPAIVPYLKGNFAIAPSYKRSERENYYTWKIVFRGVQ